MMRVASLGAMVLLAGCGRSDPTHIWTLDPVPPVTAVAASGLAAPLRVATVHVPLALDRLELVQQDAANRVTVRDFDRWGAPLGDLMRAALTADLRQRLPAGQVLAAAEPRPPRVRELVVDVAALRPTPDGYLLEASWTVVTAPNRSPFRQEERLLVPVAGKDASAQAAAITTLVGRLADAIIRALPPSA